MWPSTARWRSPEPWDTVVFPGMLDRQLCWYLTCERHQDFAGRGQQPGPWRSAIGRALLTWPRILLSLTAAGLLLGTLLLALAWRGFAWQTVGPQVWQQGRTLTGSSPRRTNGASGDDLAADSSPRPRAGLDEVNNVWCFEDALDVPFQQGGPLNQLPCKGGRPLSEA